MYTEVTWVLVSSVIQVHPQLMPDSDYPPNSLSASYNYGVIP